MVTLAHWGQDSEVQEKFMDILMSGRAEQQAGSGVGLSMLQG